MWPSAGSIPVPSFTFSPFKDQRQGCVPNGDFEMVPFTDRPCLSLQTLCAGDLRATKPEDAPGRGLLQLRFNAFGQLLGRTRDAQKDAAVRIGWRSFRLEAPIDLQDVVPVLLPGAKVAGGFAGGDNDTVFYRPAFGRGDFRHPELADVPLGNQRAESLILRLQGKQSGGPRQDSNHKERHPALN